MMSKYHLVSQCYLAEISQLLLQYGQLTERALASKAANKKPLDAKQQNPRWWGLGFKTIPSYEPILIYLISGLIYGYFLLCL